MSLHNIGTFNALNVRGSTAGRVTLVAPATVTSYSVSLPATQGGVSSVLTNNGSGILAWSAPTASAIGALTDVRTDTGLVGYLFDITDTVVRFGTANVAELKPNSLVCALGDATNKFTTLHHATSAFYGATSGSVLVVAPAVTTSYSLTLPAAAGAANSVMTTSGSGVTQFVNALSSLTTIGMSGTLTSTGGDLTFTKAGAVLTLDTATVTSLGSSLTTSGVFTTGSNLFAGGNISTSTGNLTASKIGAVLTLATGTVTASGSTLTTNGAFVVGGNISTSTGNISSSKAGAILTLDTATLTATGSTINTNADLVVGGNLTVNGTLTTVNSSNLSITDPLIALGSSNTVSDAAIDLGFWATYKALGVQRSAGLYRKNGTGVFKLFKDTTEDLTTAFVVNEAAIGYAFADLVVGNLTTAGITASGISSFASNVAVNAVLSIKNLVHQVKNYSGAGPHLPGSTGSRFNSVTNTASAVVTLPTAPTDGTTYSFLDNLSAGTLTVNSGTADFIDDGVLTTFVLDTKGQRLTLTYIVLTATWYIM